MSTDTLISIHGFKPRLSRPVPHGGKRGESRREGFPENQRASSPRPSSTPRRRGSSALIVSRISRPDGTFPEPSNLASPPAEPEDFLWVNRFATRETNKVPSRIHSRESGGGSRQSLLPTASPKIMQKMDHGLRRISSKLQSRTSGLPVVSSTSCSSASKEISR